MPIMFGPTFLTDPAHASARERWRGELIRNARTIYRAVNGVIEREHCMDELANIRCPVLVLHGDEDHAISRSRALASYEAITVENPDAVTEALREFLAALPA